MPSDEHGYVQYLFYGLFFVIAISFSLLINFLILRFSRNLGMRNVSSASEGLVRWGSTSKPSLGGFSFYMVFLISVSMLSIMPVADGQPFNIKLVGLLAASSLGFLIGLADDAYNTNPLVKFIGQFTCANLLIATGYSIQVTPLEQVNYIFTVVWIIGLMNSINMLDNMDAITSTVSLSILVGAISLIVMDGKLDNASVILMLGLAGAVIGFLYFNWHPSKMYMGDTGSQFLGVFLAGISIPFFWNIGEREPFMGIIEIRQFLIPALLFIVPLIDTTTVTIRRLMRRTSPFVGGRDHITHMLAYNGLSDRQVAIVLGTISFGSAALAVFLYGLFDTWSFAYTLLTIGYFVAVFLALQLLYNRGKRRQQAQEAEATVTELSSNIAG